MPIRLTDLISRVPMDVEARVREVRNQTRPVLQEALRAECRLVLRTPEESEGRRPGAQVPIDIEPGYPAVLEDITFPDEIEIVMLLSRYRTSLEDARSGVSELVKLRGKLAQRPDAEKWIQTSTHELQSTIDWAGFLLKVLKKHDPLSTLLSIREDFLGVYEYSIDDVLRDDRAANRARIKLYWGVIGLATEWLGCTIEDLTIVVLAHELAHAYTQLGADIEGRRWPAAAFAEADTEVKEGLAQYYTDRVLRRLARRYARAFATYEKMLPGQPPAYRTHLEWLETSTPEAVRRAMLEVRRWNEGGLSDFNRRLLAARDQLEPGARA